MRRGRIAFLAVLMLGIVFMFAGCGGDDGGGETGITSDDAAFASSVAGESFDTVMFALEMNTLASGGGGTLAPAFDGTESDPERLKAALDALVDRFNVSSIAGAAAIQQATPIECSGGGTLTFDIIAVDGNTIKITFIFENCIEGGTTTNGSLTITATDPDYTAGDPLNDLNFDPTEFTIVFDNFSSTTTVDGNVVESFSADLTISGTVTTDAETGDATGFTLTLNGSIGYTSDSNPSESFSVTYTDFEITMSEDADDNMVATINGTVDSPCLGGAVTFETVESIVIPPDDPETGEEQCPIAGVVKITRGSSTATLTFTSTGGVEIDLDSDGTVDASYASCDDVPEVCSS